MTNLWHHTGGGLAGNLSPQREVKAAGLPGIFSLCKYGGGRGGETRWRPLGAWCGGVARSQGCGGVGMMADLFAGRGSRDFECYLDRKIPLQPVRGGGRAACGVVALTVRHQSFGAASCTRLGACLLREAAALLPP